MSAQRIVLPAVVVTGAASILLATASAGPPLVPLAIRTVGNPVAGRLFTGLLVLNREPPGVGLKRVSCDAKIAGKRLRAHKARFYATGYITGPAGITCSWQIRADAGGKKLRPWGHTYSVYFGSTGVERGSFAWTIRP